MKLKRQKVEVYWPTPPGYMLVPDDFYQYEVAFRHDGRDTKIRLLTRNRLPDKIGPFSQAHNEMGAVIYETDAT